MSILVMMNRMKALLERSGYGVCTWLAERMGIASARVRLYFIYLTFAAMGSPIIIYLFMAFWLNVRRYIDNGRKLFIE